MGEGTNLERSLVDLIEAHPDGIVVTTIEGIVKYANQAALELFARKLEDFEGERLRIPLEVGASAEIAVPRESDDRIGEVRVAKVMWQGEPSLLAAVRDVTARKKAETEALRMVWGEGEGELARYAKRVSSEMLIALTHALRSSLGAIIGFTKLMHTGRAGPLSPLQTEYLADVLTGSGRLLDLINKLTTFALRSGESAASPQKGEPQKGEPRGQ